MGGDMDSFLLLIFWTFGYILIKTGLDAPREEYFFSSELIIEVTHHGHNDIWIERLHNEVLSLKAVGFYRACQVLD